MHNDNPYAAPQAELITAEVSLESANDISRCGNLLVMHRNAVLPDVCVKSNKPAHGRRLKRTLVWHNPWVYLTVVYVFVYLAAALITTKKVNIEIDSKNTSPFPVMVA